MKYKSAKELQILPEEHKALIAFVKAPDLGRIVEVNGHAHFYDQSYADDDSTAKLAECGTAGCVAGFVFAHVKTVQKKRRLRGTVSADGYIEAACDDNYDYLEHKYTHIAPLLQRLYRMAAPYKLSTAKKVVETLLRHGKVSWPRPDGVKATLRIDDEL